MLIICAVFGTYYWSMKDRPSRPKKKMGAKKAKREAMKQGLTTPGE